MGSDPYFGNPDHSLDTPDAIFGAAPLGVHYSIDD